MRYMEKGADLYVIALMIVATLTEKAVMNNFVNVQLIEERITVLTFHQSVNKRENRRHDCIPSIQKL